MEGMKRSREKRGVEWQVPEGRWSLADGAATVAAYEASGLSMRAFGAAHGVGTQRVSYWRSKVRGDAGAAGGGFVPIGIAGEPASANGSRSVEVHLRNGRSLTIRGGWDEASVRTWVSGLEASS